MAEVLGVRIHSTHEKAWTEGLEREGIPELVVDDVADPPAGYRIDRCAAMEHVLKLAVQAVVGDPKLVAAGAKTIMHAQYGHYRIDEGPLGMRALVLLEREDEAKPVDAPASSDDH